MQSNDIATNLLLVPTFPLDKALNLDAQIEILSSKLPKKFPLKLIPLTSTNSSNDQLFVTDHAVAFVNLIGHFIFFLCLFFSHVVQVAYPLQKWVALNALSFFTNGFLSSILFFPNQELPGSPIRTKIMRNFAVLLLLGFIWVFLVGSICCLKPAVVNIGAVFTFDSVIGRAAKPAMEAAIADINADPSILNGTKLNFLMEDSNCSGFLGSVGVLQVLEKKIVAIIGPQSSVVAHVISQIGSALQVPQVSYGATDPTLSALQLPFFLRATLSDSYQMAAMADLIGYHGWKEVIAIFLDDDYGRNGISSLGDELQKKTCHISHAFALPSLANLTRITEILNNSKLLGPRVYVVHVGPDPQLRIFTIAHKLGMLATNYVWFATDWLATTLDSSSPTDLDSLDILNGVVGLRPHTPQSKGKRDLWNRLSKMQPKGLANSVLNAYGLYAYDSVWIVAKAVDKFLKENGNVTFSSTGKVFGSTDSEIQVGKLKVFNGGTDLLRIIMQTNYTGLSGRIQFGEDRSIINGSYDVININQKEIHTVGYWSNYSGFSVSPPEGQENFSSLLDQKLDTIVWPGGESKLPRGWVIADAGKPLRIAFPKRASFVDFVTQVNNTDTVRGYVIDIFQEALKFIPYEVPYKFEPFGDGRVNPSYDELIKSVANNVFDAAVGDIAIVTNRTKIVDFSQPYTTTGLIIVAPVQDSKSSAWVFLKPFTVEMWCVTAASFVIVGVVIWILEHRINDHFRGPPKRQMITICLFSFSTLFKANQEATISPLSRLVMLVWLFLLLVITSSYTASLTSILTIQKLWSPIRGIDELVASNLPIGYQVGSFAYDYLAESLFVPRSRLVELHSPEDYEDALRRGPNGGGVGAIVDELPYLELFLSQTKEFGIIGQPFTRSGWGFAFQRGSRLAVDMSTAILRLSESGKLQELHDAWLCKLGCPEERGGKSEPDKLQLISFWGLYLLCGIASLVALFMFFLKIIHQYIRYQQHHRRSEVVTPTPISSNTGCTQTIQSFIRFIDEKEEAIKSFFRAAHLHGAQNGNQLQKHSGGGKEKDDSEIQLGTTGMI